MSKAADLLMDRYPQIGFLFHYTQGVPFVLFLDSNGQLNGEREGWILHNGQKEKKPDLEGVEIVYVFGLGLAYSFYEYRTWLHSHRGHRLVYLEEDLGVIAAFLQTEHAETVLSDLQVHLEYIPDPESWHGAIEKLADQFVSDRVVCTLLNTYPAEKKKKFYPLQLQLMRASTSLHALLSESLHAHKLFANLYENFQRIPEAFYVNRWEGKFKNIPAVICGAGPSLTEALPFLKGIENRALIFGGGSAFTALSRNGVEPHCGIALDPNREEYERLEPATAFQVPFLYANRLLPSVFSLVNGPIGYIRSDTGGMAETWIEDKLGIEGVPIGPDLGREAFSVTTLAVALARTMGCNPIILVGVDLAYTENLRYAQGVLPAGSDPSPTPVGGDKRLAERVLFRKDRKGKKVQTLLKWVMESSAISSYAEAHPECRFINATEGGLGFSHIPYTPLEEVVEQLPFEQWDIRGMIHAAVEESRFDHISPERIDNLFLSLKGSLENLKELAEKILQEKTGRRIVLESDFAEESAFECFLQPLAPALERLLERYFPEQEHTEMKWKEIRASIQNYLDIYRATLSKEGK